MRPVRHLLVTVVALAALTSAAVRADAGPRRARVAQQAAADAGKRVAATDAASRAVRASETRRAAILTERAALTTRYQAELAEIDKLKRQRASWRRDRQLRGKLAASLETAEQLATLSAELSQLDGTLAKQRRALIAAIDAELAAGGATATRARTLRSLRGDTASRLAPRKVKKIVLPDDEIDPNADADELEAQARALRDGEAELTKQIASLDKQATRFRKQADLKKEHARAGELASRDDGQPRRTSGSSGGRGGEVSTEDSAPQTDDGLGGDPPADPAGGGAFEGDPAVVLADVVDGDTVDALRKAERSTDPSAKAIAVEKARDQVAKRLRALAQRRKEIEARARKLRD